jgi:DNA-directed RNA polymerase specialized sigma24 family protein
MRTRFMEVSKREHAGGDRLAPRRRPVVGFVLPLVGGDPRTAEDVVREALIRGWEHEGRRRPDRAGSWLRAP